eukprot:11365307-Karenia_brevis.AAC.1
MSDDEQNDAMQQKIADENRLILLWDVIKENIACYMEDSLEDYLTDDNTAFSLSLIHISEPTRH